VFPARKGPCKRGIDSGEGRWTLAKVKMGYQTLIVWKNSFKPTKMSQRGI
jgi:hypothetical protein